MGDVHPRRYGSRGYVVEYLRKRQAELEEEEEILEETLLHEEPEFSEDWDP